MQGPYNTGRAAWFFVSLFTVFRLVYAFQHDAKLVTSKHVLYRHAMDFTDSFNTSNDQNAVDATFFPYRQCLILVILVSLRPTGCPAFCVHSVTPTVLDGFFPYYAQMITSISGCVAQNDHWPWPISTRSFNHAFAIKLLKYGTSSLVRSTAHTVLDGFFPY